MDSRCRLILTSSGPESLRGRGNQKLRLQVHLVTAGDQRQILQAMFYSRGEDQEWRQGLASTCSGGKVVAVSKCLEQIPIELAMELAA